MFSSKEREGKKTVSNATTTIDPITVRAHKFRVKHLRGRDERRATTARVRNGVPLNFKTQTIFIPFFFFSLNGTRVFLFLFFVIPSASNHAVLKSRITLGKINIVIRRGRNLYF